MSLQTLNYVWVVRRIHCLDFTQQKKEGRYFITPILYNAFHRNRSNFYIKALCCAEFCSFKQRHSVRSFFFCSARLFVGIVMSLRCTMQVNPSTSLSTFKYYYNALFCVINNRQHIIWHYIYAFYDKLVGVEKFHTYGYKAKKNIPTSHSGDRCLVRWVIPSCKKTCIEGISHSCHTVCLVSYANASKVFSLFKDGRVFSVISIICM